MDHALRALERAAAVGSQEARERLRAAELRLGDATEAGMIAKLDYHIDEVFHRNKLERSREGHVFLRAGYCALKAWPEAMKDATRHLHQYWPWRPGAWPYVPVQQVRDVEPRDLRWIAARALRCYTGARERSGAREWCRPSWLAQPDQSRLIADRHHGEAIRLLVKIGQGREWLGWWDPQAELGWLVRGALHPEFNPRPAIEVARG